MSRTKSFFLNCAFLALSAGLLPAARISLDTNGGDPDLTSPNFSFQIDAQGNFGPTSFRNVSNPAINFGSLTLTLPFSPNFYFFAPTGPTLAGTVCIGGNSFNTCAITNNDANTTVTLAFSGLDATHIGVPFGNFLNIVASGFEPNQVVGAAATATDAPEPGAFGLAATGLALAGVIGRKKLLKLGVRS